MIPPDEPSEMVIAQRVRNRIMEYLAVASSYAEQQDYQRKVPKVHIPDEMINQWEDWVDGDRLDWYSEPVFSPVEQTSLRHFHAIWNSVANDTPDPLPALSALIGTEPWERLRKAAEDALGVFSIRGRFDEEREVFPE